MIISGNDKVRKEDSVLFCRPAAEQNGSSEAQGAQIVRSAQSALPSPATTPEASGAAGSTVLDRHSAECFGRRNHQLQQFRAVLDRDEQWKRDHLPQNAATTHFAIAQKSLREGLRNVHRALRGSDEMPTGRGGPDATPSPGFLARTY